MLLICCVNTRLLIKKCAEWNLAQFLFLETPFQIKKVMLSTI
ncbi:hypothetical protein F652_1927 [Enterobacteriaceae bacterium bta3-1]|nr:hypothetical protein F652_1927 [Enterobacteriaceae bacterium bta3-1]